MAVPSSYRLNDEIAVPEGLNVGLSVAGQDFMLGILGRPRENLTQDDLPITNKKLAFHAP